MLPQFLLDNSHGNRLHAQGRRHDDATLAGKGRSKAWAIPVDPTRILSRFLRSGFVTQGFGLHVETAPLLLQRIEIGGTVSALRLDCHTAALMRDFLTSFRKSGSLISSSSPDGK
ncbi:hypothetical protein HNY73_023186 [Argiope bruennichi]|uniref:Uncharacterized protein n=1 Tax=Argiope bruennichi TaxID=94029 RepID=A0A8T0E314_ARGBR|nr:hypothetical protein HNY73_023186 [Argiope bruennichi]